MKHDEDDKENDDNINMIIHLQKAVLPENIKNVKKNQVLYQISF